MKMFNSKRTPTISKTTSRSKTTSGFVNKALETSAETRSGNNAKKYSTTGDPFVDQFGKLGSFREIRPFSEIEKDCEFLWAHDPETTVRFMFYIRMITRRIQLTDGSYSSVPQKGAELKHEGIMRLLWLHQKDERTFLNYLPLIPLVGSWKDIIQMLSYDIQYHGWNDKILNWEEFGHFILSGLSNDNQRELLKKYLPQIRSNKQCTTIESQANNVVAKWICSLLYGEKRDGSTYKQYRKLKSSGTAHEWQQLISQQRFNEIDFNTIHGRALSKLVNSKFLENQGLSQKYNEWITDDETEAKYTGFVHELFQPCDYIPVGWGRAIGHKSLSNVPTAVRETINKQFATLVDKGGEKQQTKLIVVRDTSGSMGSAAPGIQMSCYSIAKALALYFSEFLTGEFEDAWIEFHSTAKMHTWKGSTPLERWYNDQTCAVGSTNFQSVIQLFCSLKAKGVSEEDFPTGILCISDGEFNSTSLDRTNVEAALNSLRNAGFSSEYVENFVIVLWNLQNSFYGRGSGEKFETYGDIQNVFYFSGYSASVISFLTSKIKNARELFDEAMNQEILNIIAL